MANLVAPVTMNRPPMPANLSDWLIPEAPGNTYLGPNIDWSKVPGNILNILTAMDPSGMMTSPAGLIWGKATSPVWAKMLPKYKELGSTIEKQFPRIGAVTKETPVNLMSKLPDKSSTMAEYFSASRLNPTGRINLYGPRDPWATVHEMLHRLYETDPMARAMGHEMMSVSPVGTELNLAIRGVTPKMVESEYFAYALEDMLKGDTKNKVKLLEKFADIKAPVEMKQTLLDFLQSVPENKQKETFKAITGVFKKSEPVTKAVTKEQKELIKHNEIMDVIREEIGKVIQKPGKGGVISSKKGGGMIVNRPEKLSEYLEDVPKPTKYGPKGERIWEF